MFCHLPAAIVRSVPGVATVAVQTYQPSRHAVKTEIDAETHVVAVEIDSHVPGFSVTESSAGFGGKVVA